MEYLEISLPELGKFTAQKVYTYQHDMYGANVKAEGDGSVFGRFQLRDGYTQIWTYRFAKTRHEYFMISQGDNVLIKHAQIREEENLIKADFYVAKKRYFSHVKFIGA